MRHLISILAAGLLAGGTALTTAGEASAGATGARQQTSCINAGSAFYSVTKNGVNYYLGAPRKPTPGAAAFLKPTTNGSTSWTLCYTTTPGRYVFENGGLALTSRDGVGADVTMETMGGSNGFASQQWTLGRIGSTVTWFNPKAGLFLRVRNNGPQMGQTVTTGNTPTLWTAS